MTAEIYNYRELSLYRSAIDAAMEIFETSRRFPWIEKYALVDQIRMSSRSVCTNIAEAWRRRPHRRVFIARLHAAESQASETQVLIELAHRCRYLSDAEMRDLDAKYHRIIAELLRMVREADTWAVR